MKARSKKQCPLEVADISFASCTPGLARNCFQFYNQLDSSATECPAQRAAQHGMAIERALGDYYADLAALLYGGVGGSAIIACKNPCSFFIVLYYVARCLASFDVSRSLVV